MRSKGSTTDVADPEEKMGCTPEVPAPPGPECSSKGWWTMLGLEVADPNAEADAGGGVDVDATSCVLMTMTFRSIRSCTALRNVKQLSVKCLATRWKLQKRFARYHPGSGFGNGRISGSLRSDATLGKTALSGSTSGVKRR